MELPIIAYREFSDVPRCFFVHCSDGYAYFDCVFDEQLDEYPNDYKVYFFPDIAGLNLIGSWDGIAEAGTEIGKVPVAKVQFDPTRRKSIGSAVVEMLAH